MKGALKELERTGLHLLDNEELTRVLDLKKGLSEELSIRRSALVLTNQRLLYWERSGPRIALRSAFLGDVPRMELVREKRRWWYLIAGIVLIAAGFAFWIWAREFLSTLGPLSGIFSPLDAFFARFAMLGLLVSVMAGLGLMSYYPFSGKEELIMLFGGTEIKVPSPSSKRSDVSLFINDFFKTKGLVREAS